MDGRMKDDDVKRRGGASNAHGVDRRSFLALGGAGAALSMVELARAPKAAAADMLEDAAAQALVTEHGEVPVPISEGYRRFDQKNTVFSRAISGRDEDTHKAMRTFEREDWRADEPGFTRVDFALQMASWAGNEYMSMGSEFGVPNSGVYHWEQRDREAKRGPRDHDWVHEECHAFASKAEAANVVKRAARAYGADLVGITHHNPRWDYERLYVSPVDREVPWEAFPFKPRTVIVLGFEMDYETMAAAPTYTAGATVGENYSRMAFTAYKLSVMLKALGYHAVAAGNDLGLSVPYAVQAGLGEAGRNGLLVNARYGPRLRLAKVYTDLDPVAFDRPVTFGVREFCERCERCAEACPSDSIAYGPPTMAPPEDRENWFNNPGVEKWYVDAKGCFLYWCESNTDCGSCITSCPYNKPDFWHHTLVEKVTRASPGALHSFMREMDEWFGYGDTADPAAVRRFWDDRNRKYLGT